MKTYRVTVQARIIKTLTVEAETEQDAVETAHEQFSVLPEDGPPEEYIEDTLVVTEKEQGAES